MQYHKPSPAINSIIVISIWIIVFSLFTFGVARSCFAQYDDGTALALVRCLRAECNICHDPQQRASIASILRKRAKYRGETLREHAESYCAVFNRHTDRARDIASSTWDRPNRGSKRWWRKMRAWVHKFLMGKVKDPEPASWDWGSNEDTYRMVGRTLLRSFCFNGKCNHIWSR